MSVTLKTIAEYTGLSVTTVSRALKDGDDVKQPTIDLVKAAAKKGNPVSIPANSRIDILLNQPITVNPSAYSYED